MAGLAFGRGPSRCVGGVGRLVVAFDMATGAGVRGCNVITVVAGGALV